MTFQVKPVFCVECSIFVFCHITGRSYSYQSDPFNTSPFPFFLDAFFFFLTSSESTYDLLLVYYCIYFSGQLDTTHLSSHMRGCIDYMERIMKICEFMLSLRASVWSQLNCEFSSILTAARPALHLLLEFNKTFTHLLLLMVKLASFYTRNTVFIQWNNYC